MALENVIEEILAKAERSKEEIINQAKEEAKKILDEAIDHASGHTKRFEDETRKLIDESERMEISSLNIHLHKMVLETKKDILDEVYNQFLEKLKNLDGEKRKELIGKLIEKARKELPDARFVYCNEKDKKFISEIKNLEFKGVINCTGGVIVKNSDGRIRVDYTFDQIAENVKEMMLNEIAKRLFEHG